ncbi:hypothetical protein BU24DRAFT_447645 [Aaosphaeria arxii CBS 175.79]|uniref:C2H2-type domain-containing protein n=1 Tax=Aaosphaeria arxii CBS 175.79 TaxID=1450172 RepID=A0A6A5Y2N4_9PLEO|nr:uncharacterized protein BU24DRAFT_447645 [Aaosphaeria arxii CBS 175.79]KAF2019060.1 hypothetical protein BU24DRAFT_447645 [Aaosphaeria arxii CBS 175.79]
MDSPNSDLSDYASDYFPEDVKGRRASYEHTPDHDGSGRPSKRPRLHLRAHSDPPVPQLPPIEDYGEISEDTDGSVPASPHHPGMSAEDDYGQEQVSACKWEGCEAGDLGDMDKLVDHLHEDHIGTRQKRYSCEWSDCSRKGIPHASGYALRAHMRSHTREKPFYCTLPECDRSFTRSDALAKHMRTVHETEALRPSDPVPKHHSSNPSNKVQRLRLVLNNDSRKHDKGSASPSHAANSAAAIVADAEYAHNNAVYVQETGNTQTMVQFPEDMNFSDRELALPAPELFHLLNRQLRWATHESEQLRADVELLEKKRKNEWVAKELLMENYMEASLSHARRRRMDAGLLDEPESFQHLDEDASAAKTLKVEAKEGRLPWWREAGWLQKLTEAEKTREKLLEREEPAPEETQEGTQDEIQEGTQEETQEDTQEVAKPVESTEEVAA